MRKSSNGFTIVELLIVVVVIAILAAISVVAYSGIQNRARVASVESDIAILIKKLELAKVDLGRYPVTQSEFPSDFKFNKSVYDTTQNNMYYCVDRTNDRYALGLRMTTLTGYIVNSGVYSTSANIYGAITCDAIGKTWVNDATTAVIQGYSGPPSSTWNATWGWTN